MTCPSSRPLSLVDVTDFLLQAPFPQVIALFQPQSTPAREADFRSSPLPQLLQNQSPCRIPGSVTVQLLETPSHSSAPSPMDHTDRPLLTSLYPLITLSHPQL